ncbi:MAG TPA: prolyl oligopeptidase family serine peptidase, partial [Planctomycetaceae bacterium]|nr:prolyl oligopeptidase family serine peptidase [Planctomycetaceae bacterium]
MRTLHFPAQVVLVLVAVLSSSLCRAAEELPALTEIRVTSTLDKSQQPSRVWAPESASNQPTPMLVFLHSWSSDYRQANTDWQREAVERGWIYLHPNFRGVNQRPEACGSELARQDILDAIDDVSARYRVDPERIYLAGTSGGGHMAMLMAGYHPKRFSAVSAWVGISDLAAWHRFHTRDGKPTKYAEMMEACLGGPPGTSDAIDAQYRSRSPLTVLGRVGDLPLDLNAGVNDGHTGSVPIRHTLAAFNVVARAGEHRQISTREIEQLSNDRKLQPPGIDDTLADETYGRELLLRRRAGQTRVTIFDGGHEGLASAGCAWLSQQKRRTETA